MATTRFSSMRAMKGTTACWIRYRAPAPPKKRLEAKALRRRPAANNSSAGNNFVQHEKHGPTLDEGGSYKGVPRTRAGGSGHGSDSGLQGSPDRRWQAQSERDLGGVEHCQLGHSTSFGSSR